MHLWFWLALVAPILWATCNYLDKYLTTRFTRESGVGALIIVSSLFGLVVLPIITLIKPGVIFINPSDAITLIIGSIISTLGILAYLYAMQDEDVSFVIPFYELIPVVGFILGYTFLHETLSSIELLGSIFIIVGAIILSLELGVKFKLKYKLAGLMLIAVLAFSINGLLFKSVALSEDYLIAAFWSYVGLVISGIAFYLIPVYRTDLYRSIRTSGIKVFSLNAINEILFIIANLMVQYAILLAPLALVYSVNSFQSVFVLLFGILLTIFAPHIYKEDLKGKILLQKFVGILIILIGAWFVNQ